MTLIASSIATDMIGIHAVFGAFALGAVIPHDSDLALSVTEKLEDLVVVLLLPAFFAFTGMRTQIGLVTGWGNWALCLGILGIATLGKFGGSLVASRLTGLGWRDSAALGVLMNTRGLMELIVLNIGLELKVISPTLFAMLVIMAVVTTFLTTPVLHLITRRRKSAEASVDKLAAQAPPPRKGVVVALANPDDMVALVNLTLQAAAPDEPPPRAIALVQRKRDSLRAGGGLLEKTAPRSDVLARALEHAKRVGSPLLANALWTDDTAGDILRVADDVRASWVLLGFHRPVFRSDVRGGVVKEVLETAVGREVHVGIIIHRHERKLERLFAVVDDSRDGRAALDLACRLGRRKESNLQIILVPREGTEPEPTLAALLKEAGRRIGRWLHTDVLGERSQFQLAFKTTGDLVIIGSSLADSLGLPLDTDPGDGRCIVVVQGGTQPTFAEATEPAPETHPAPRPTPSAAHS